MGRMTAVTSRCTLIRNLCTARNVSQNYYQVLGVNKDCSQREIRDSFIKLSKQLHPDTSHREEADHHDKFLLLYQAYSTLSKPARRRVYDLSLDTADPITSDLTSATASSKTARDALRDKVKRDESIWEMRDKSQDYKYDGKPYYGIQGVRRIPNWLIAVGCALFTVFGMVGHFAVIRYAARKSDENHLKKDFENNLVLARTRFFAKKHGNHHQLKMILDPDNVQDQAVVLGDDPNSGL